MQNGAILNNDGSIDVQSDFSLSFNGGAAASINNSGTFTKSAGPAALGIPVGFNNTGTVNGNSGQIRFTAGGSGTGSFVAGTGAAIEFAGSTYTLNAGANLSGAGFVRLSSGTLTIANNVSAERFEIASGTLNGTGTLTVNSLLNWNGGTMGGSGATTVSAGANLVIAGSGTKILDARTLNLQGTTNWSGPGAFGMQTGAILNNSGNFDVQGDLNLFNGGAAPAFNNSGAFTKSAGSATLAIGVAFNNTGTVNGNSGQIRFNLGGTATGDFVAASGAAIEFNGATYTLNTGADLSGAGFVRLSSGTLTIADAVSAERFEITSGTLNGTGTLTVSNLLNWTGGTMGGSGATTIPAWSECGNHWFGHQIPRCPHAEPARDGDMDWHGRPGPAERGSDQQQRQLRYAG
jgi:phage baseplate assembly protein gpV